MSVSDKPSTLRAQMKHHEPIVCFQQNQRDEVRLVGGGGIVGAISANPGMKNQNYLCISVKTKQIDMRTAENEAHPLDGNDDKEPQAVCYAAAFMGGQGARARSIAYCDDGTTPTLKAVLSGGNTVPDVVYPINLMVATRGGRDDMRTCFGIGEPGSPQFTLSAAHEHGVCYEAKDGRN